MKTLGEQTAFDEQSQTRGHPEKSQNREWSVKKARMEHTQTWLAPL